MERQIKERPILFSTPMVKMILEGRKTMTRRVIKAIDVLNIPEYRGVWAIVTKKETISIQSFNEGSYPDACPYGQPRDRLWVRESFAYVQDPESCARDDEPCEIAYKADWATEGTVDEAEEVGLRWKPSIHMPRWASRITLEIISIRVELLRDISEDDAKAEGVEKMFDVYPEKARYKLGFANLWNSINEKHGFGWDANPWVWVIEFKRIKEERSNERESMGDC